MAVVIPEVYVSCDTCENATRIYNPWQDWYEDRLSVSTDTIMRAISQQGWSMRRGKWYEDDMYYCQTCTRENQYGS